MSAVELLEWSYSPPNYFEEPIEVVRDDYTMKVSSGQVEARVDPNTFAANPRIRDEIHTALNDLFLGAQLATYRAYELSDPRRIFAHPDGRRDVSFELSPVTAIAMAGTLDVCIAGADGSVAHDSRAERVASVRALAERVQRLRPSSAPLSAMLASFNNAVREPQNELVHLYEVRDALSVEFGGKSGAIATLGLSSATWSRLGQLCNDDPLRQGRHRGKSGATLRDATHAELQEARDIARSMLTLYIDHLERSAATGPSSGDG